MHVVVLSAGPSVKNYRPARDGGKLTIGVNRAAELFRCDWWCCGDWQAIEILKPLGQPNLCTMNASADWVQAQLPSLLLGSQTRRWWDMVREHNPTFGIDTYSAPMALLLAWELGAKTIEVWGADMGGTVDCGGNDDQTGGRSQDRWTKERLIWNGTIAWLTAKGVTVTTGKG